MLPLLVAVAIMFFSVRKKTFSVDWMVITRKEARETVVANGRVAGNKVIPLSLRKSGIVSRVIAGEGGTFKKDDTLLILDNREDQNRVLLRRNDLEIAVLNLKRLGTIEFRQKEERLIRAQIQEKSAQIRKKRADTLFLQGAITQAALDDASREALLARSQRIESAEEFSVIKSTEKQLQEAKVKQARLLLNEAEIELSQTVLFAPADGKVIDIVVGEGELASSVSPLIFFLPDDTVLSIEVMVDETEIAVIRRGQKAVVSTTGSRSFTMNAVVSTIIGRIDAERGTGTVILSVPEPSRILIADQTVTAQIITGTVSDALTLEQRFCEKGIDGSFVFKKDGKKVQKNKVKLLPAGNGQNIIRSGVAEGDTIVMAPSLYDGASVVLKKQSGE